MPAFIVWMLPVRPSLALFCPLLTVLKTGQWEHFGPPKALAFAFTVSGEDEEFSLHSQELSRLKNTQML